MACPWRNIKNIFSRPEMLKFYPHSNLTMLIIKWQNARQDFPNSYEIGNNTPVNKNKIVKNGRKFRLVDQKDQRSG